MLHTNARRHRPAFALPYIGLVPFAAEWPVADIADTLAPDQHRRRLLFVLINVEDSFSFHRRPLHLVRRLIHKIPAHPIKT